MPARRTKQPTVQKLLARRERALHSSGQALALMFARLGGQSQGSLIRLWQAWPEVMGEYLSALGQPRGHKERTLIVGAPDSIAMQELSLMRDEILERANAFLRTEFFHSVRVQLLQGKESLSRDAPSPGRVEQPRHAAQPDDAPRIGALLGKLSPDSPIARCYEAFVRTAARK